jgi:hypothetical protein
MHRSIDGRPGQGGVTFELPRRPDSRISLPRLPQAPPVPVWRNGRRDRLKICFPQGSGGSSPSTGTNLFRYHLMKRILSTALLSVLVVGLAACSSLDARTKKLQLGMTREQVVKTLGGDYSMVGAKKDADGSATEVLRFGEKKDQGLFAYFQNGKLVQWGDQQVLKNMPGAK